MRKFFYRQEMESASANCGICGHFHDISKCNLLQIKGCMPDETIPSRARLTLPKQFRIEKMADGTLSIIAIETISKGTQFGPLVAQKVFSLNPENVFPLKIFTADHYFNEYFLDLTSEENCNWLMFMNPAHSLEEQNAMCFQHKNQIYYATTRNIQPGEFLKVWYSPFYAKKMKKRNLELQYNAQNEVYKECEARKDMNKLLKRQQNIVNRKNWTCKFCGIVETNITKFAVHISDHYTKQLRKICEICKATFSTRKGLKKHLKMVHGPKMAISKEDVVKTSTLHCQSKDSLLGGPLLNEVLTESMDNSNILLRQTQFDIRNMETSNMLLDSDNLNVDNLLTDNVKYLEHFNFDIDESQEQFLCDICLKSFSKLKLLVQHLKRHTGKFMCSHCFMIFCNNENLRAHSCFNVDYKKFKCALCDRKFSLKKYLSRHIKAIHRKEYKCKNCQKPYFSIKEAREHNCPAIPIEDKEKFDCLICGKVFLRDLYLKKHMRCCHESKPEGLKNVKKRSYMCEICAKTFTKAASLNKHFKNHLEPGFQCSSCDKKFFRKDVLQNHVAAFHKDKLVQCKECGKSFKSLKYLKTHMQQHAQKAHKCPDCDMLFAYRSNLTKHQRRIHSKTVVNNAAFVCPICKKGVNFKTSLARHLKNIHPGASEHLNTEPDKKPAQNIQAFGEELSEFSTNLINTLGNETEPGGEQKDLNISFEDNFNSLTQAADEREVCLNMPDIPAAEDQQITLSENAFIMDNGTIVQPLDQSNVIVYVLDSKLNNNSATG